jgi:hypothetical protein
MLAIFPNAPNVDALNGFAVPQTLRQKATGLRTPYLMQSSLSYERQLPYKSTVSVNYLNTRALHQLRSRNINAPLPGTFVAGCATAASGPSATSATSSSTSLRACSARTS